jgi:hypothetical protein
MKKTSVSVATILFALIALLQLTRFVSGWEVVINGMMIPLWASLIATGVTGGMAFWLWRDNK